MVRWGVAGLAVLASAAPAHETFVVVPQPAVVGMPLALRLTSSMRFPRAETAIKPGRVARAVAATQDAAQAVRVGSAGATWLNLAVTPDRAGTMVVAIDLGPKAIALTPDKVAEYFAEVGASPAVRAAYAAQPAPRQWNEFYTKHAKAMVCVAPCRDAAAAMRGAGQALEFVAADAGLRRFVLLAAGKPLAGQPVQIVDKGGKVVRAVTGADGGVVVAAGVKAPLLLATTVLRAPAKAGAAFTSDFATLSVGPR